MHSPFLHQLTSEDKSGTSMGTWSPCKDKRLAVAIFNFHGFKVQHGLSIQIGDTLHIIEECNGWYRGSNIHDRTTRGIFPSSYVALKPFKYLDPLALSSSSILIPDVSIQPLEDAVSLEIVSSLREWHSIWSKQLYLNGQRDTFDTLSNMMLQLIEQRRLLLSGNLTQDEAKDLKLKITRTIDTGNRLLSLDFIPRDECTGAIIDPEQVSPIHLYRIHMNSLDPTHRKLYSRASNAPSLLSRQIVQDLLHVSSPLDMASILRLAFQEDNSTASDKPVSFARSKLECLQEIIENSELMSNYEARSELIDFISSHLKSHLDHMQELKLCCLLISDILDSLHSQRLSPSGYGNSINHLVELMVSNLLSSLCRVIIDLSASPAIHLNPSLCSNLLNEYIVCLLSLFRLMDNLHFDHFMSKLSRREKKDTLLRMFYIFKHSFAHDFLLPDWLSLRMVFNHIILCTMQELSMTLITDFLDSGSYEVTSGAFDEDLWKGYLSLSVSFLTQDCLQLENFTSQKRECIIDRYGDMRVLMGFQILPMWEKLGELKIHFVPSLVAPFLEVTLVPEKELRTATIPIFYDMIDAEVKATASFNIVSSQLIDHLDHLVGDERKGDADFKQLLQTILLERIRQYTPTWKDQGILFVKSISKLLELLLDHRAVMDGHENRDKQMSCTVNLLRFFKEDINRNEMYLRYIHKLSELHIPSGNYTEAAFTLKLHADILKWSTNLITNHMVHPIDSTLVRLRDLPEWQVKEKLYHEIITYFDKGKCWEEGIPLIEELSDFYKKQLFDYRKLSQLYMTHARFLDNIMSALRPQPEYFRVGFFGQGFPAFLKNKLFIYRGLEYEKIGAFTTRLQAEFPQSVLLTKSGPPDESIILSEGQHIQICSVRPIAEPRCEFEGQAVPDEILSYYLTNNVRSFIYDRPIHKGPVDKVNEFKSLWIERSILRTAAKLPGILRWSEVVSKKVIEVSPIEHACETVEKMVRELEKLVTSYNQEQGKPIHPLSMRLQGIIEATVNGGIAKYQDAFFNANYIALYSEQLPCIRKLKQLIHHQVRILEGGLSLHGRLAPANVQPLHKRLVETFTLMRQRFHDSSSHIDAGTCIFDSLSIPNKRPSIINTPLPPIPRNKAEKHPVAESENEAEYQLIRPEASEDTVRRISNDDIYSIPGEKSSACNHRDSVSSVDAPALRRVDSLSSRRVSMPSSDHIEPPPTPPGRAPPAPPPPLPPSRYRVTSSNGPVNGSHPCNRNQTRSLHNSPSTVEVATTQPLFLLQTMVTTSSASSSPSSSSSSSSQNGVSKVANSNFYSPCPLACKKSANNSSSTNNNNNNSNNHNNNNSSNSDSLNRGDCVDSSSTQTRSMSEVVVAGTSSMSVTSPPPPLPPRNGKDHSSKPTNHPSSPPVLPPLRHLDVPSPNAPAIPTRKTVVRSISSETNDSMHMATEVKESQAARRSASTRRPPPPTPNSPVTRDCDEAPVSLNSISFSNSNYLGISYSNNHNVGEVNGSDKRQTGDAVEQVVVSSSISVVPVVVNDALPEGATHADGINGIERADVVNLPHAPAEASETSE